MTRQLNSSVFDAVGAPHVPYILFAQLAFSEVLRLCSAGYNYQWVGQTWLGIGALGGIDAIQEKAGLEAIGLNLTLSGVPSDMIAVSLGEQYQGKSCMIWLGLLGEDLQLIADPVRMFSGRMDTMSIEVGDTATITVSCESKMVAWDKARVRRYNNEDQQARHPGDRGFEYVSQMVEKNLLWGR